MSVDLNQPCPLCKNKYGMVTSHTFHKQSNYRGTLEVYGHSGVGCAKWHPAIYDDDNGDADAFDLCVFSLEPVVKKPRKQHAA